MFKQKKITPILLDRECRWAWDRNGGGVVQVQVQVQGAISNYLYNIPGLKKIDLKKKIDNFLEYLNLI
jgi:hypothetical protein